MIKVLPRTLLPALLLLGTVPVTPVPAAEKTPDMEEMWRIIRQQQEQIRALQEKISATESRLEDTDQKVTRTEQQTAETATRIEATADAVERISSDENQGGWTDRVRIGGYGSVRAETNDLEEEQDTFTYRRFVLTADARVTDRLQAFMELEFERFAELELEKQVVAEPGEFESVQVVEGTGGSEISMEQAWARYRISPALNVDAGAMLVPLGRFNILHDDNQWNLNRRPLVDKGAPVLPSAAAWPELGLGLSGHVSLGRHGLLDYRLYAVNGVQMDLEFEQKLKSEAGNNEAVIEAEFEPSRGTFSKDLNDNKAVTGRLAFKPRPGHELAVSGYYGRYTPAFLGDESVWSVALDGMNTFGGLELEYELVHTDWGDADRVIADFGRVVPRLAGEGTAGSVKTEAEFGVSGLSRSRTGYWLEMRYPLQSAWLRKSILGRGFGDPRLEPTIRFEQVFFNEVDGSDPTLNRASLGLAYRPVPEWVFSLAGEYTWTNADSLDGLTNYLNAAAGEDDAFALTLGAAFGF